MKKFFFTVILLGLFYNLSLLAQTGNKIENIIIITTDGFRWQEVFKGMDPVIASKQVDSTEIFKKYGAQTEQERRLKLMPFMWNTVASQGQIYGNRELGAKVNVTNPYWFSYPGYSEIFCGYVDTAINSNNYQPNPNTNLLEFINKQDGFKGKVAAFGTWSAYTRILNEKRSGFPVVCGYDNCGGTSPDDEQRLINSMKKDAYNPFNGGDPIDVFSQYEAMDYLKKEKPRVLYISYLETDDWAHRGHYKDYLDAANRVDNWLNDIWRFVQNSPVYKDKTLLFITVDHGRGKVNIDAWRNHHNDVIGSDEIWFAVMGPQVIAKGEIKSQIQLYQKQYAQTFAQLLGLTFKCEHPVADGFKDILLK